MKILFLTTHLNSGGITSYLRTLTKGLIARGHQVFIASSGGDMEQEFLSLGAQLKTLNIKTKSELDPRIYLALIPLINLIREHHIDVIHAQTRITQVMGRCLQTLTGKPFVTTCHGFFKTRFFRKKFPFWGKRVIAISEPVKLHLQQDFLVVEQNICLVDSGLDITDFPLVDEATKKINRKKWDLGEEPAIGIIARLSDVKGQDILIPAMKEVLQKIPKAKLLIVGEGKMETMLKDLVMTLNLHEHVKFYPIVNRTTEALSLFDVFVMPSRQEGLGLSVMEAQASGLPVVASNVGGIPTLIKDGQTGLLVEPENVHQLAQAIIKVLEDKNLAQRLGQQARSFIMQNYSSQKMVEKTIACYESVIKG